MEKAVNLASYRKEDWKRFTESAEDMEKLHNTWDEWRKSLTDLKVRLEIQGFTVMEEIVDIDDLIEYCRKN